MNPTYRKIDTDFIKKDKVISLISDAGTPTISDPGFILVNKCIEENLNIRYSEMPGNTLIFHHGGRKFGYPLL